jgi:hypothetical protein
MDSLIKTKPKYSLIIILLMASLLMFVRLGNRTLWGDEAEVALLAKNVLEFGYPNGYDGEYLVCSECGDEPETILYKNGYAWRWHPWMMHYLTAASFMLFGINRFAARFPFAVFGLLSLVVLYYFTIKLTNNKRLAILSTTLLAFFMPFYLYSRQTRYYSIVMFFSLLTLYAYLKLINSEKNSTFWFILSSILLFYTNYFPFFSIYSAVILHSLIFHKKAIKKLIISSIFVAAFTLPWFLYASIGSKIAISISGLLFGAAHVSSYIIFYIFPAMFLLFLPKILFFKDRKGIRMNQQYWLLILPIFTFMILVNFAPYDLPAFRFITFLFPVFAILNAKVILNIKKKYKYTAMIVLLLFILTNYLFVLPFKIVETPILNNLEKGSEGYLFVKDNLRIRYFLFDYIYEITHDYNSPDEKIIEYLKQNAQENDKFLTNFGDMSMVFHTGLLPINEDETPGWIILRKANSLWANIEKYNKALEKVDESYEKVIINSTDYIYPLDTPHPRIHRFRENKEMKTSDVYPYETYPIEIYQLIK